MKTKLFYKIFAFTFGMMLLITVLAHVLIFMIAPSENVLITSTTVTNEDVLAFSEVDMPQLITQTILKSFPLSFACCMVISLVFSFLFSKGITGPILSISTSVHQMSKLDRTAEISVISTDEIGGLANDINSLYQSLLVTIRNLEEEKDKVQLVEKEKIDFLRTASHELKTPVTELNATLENMILKIGEYSDYESYLPRCKEITEQLAEMIKDILNISKFPMKWPPSSGLASWPRPLTPSVSATTSRTIPSTVMTGSNTRPACMSPRPRSSWSGWNSLSVCGTRLILCPKPRAAVWMPASFLARPILK